MPNAVKLMYSASDLEYIPFLTTDRLGEFWHNVQVIAFLAMPMLVIWIATMYGGELLRVIREIFSRKKDDSEDYDDEDYRD